MGSNYEIDSYQIDDLDKKIIGLLLKDARTPYLEIARKLLVSGGTIHQRVDRLTEQGIIKGSSIKVDLERLGFQVSVLIGIHLNNAKDVAKIIKKLKTKPEVVEAYYTTGNFSLILKVVVRSIKDYQRFLVEDLQAMEELRSTESFICLDQPIGNFQDMFDPIKM